MGLGTNTFIKSKNLSEKQKLFEKFLFAKK